MGTEPGSGAGLGGPRRLPWGAIALTVAGAGLIVIAVFTIDPLNDAARHAVAGDADALRADLQGLGAGGTAMVAALVALHTFVWYPTEIVGAAVGFVYGFWPGLALLMVCWTAQGVLAYVIGRRAARPVLDRFIAAERFDKLESAVEQGGVTLLLAARMVPIVPFSLFSYVAGAAEVPLHRFVWTTALGYIPITALSVYFGTRLEDLSLTVVWGTAAAMLALLLLARRLRPLFEGDDR
jgi:uncharacterized membrane protein YdjX (TVP38/TMEM64 family)